MVVIMSKMSSFPYSFLHCRNLHYKRDFLNFYAAISKRRVEKYASQIVMELGAPRVVISASCFLGKIFMSLFLIVILFLTIVVELKR